MVRKLGVALVAFVGCTWWPETYEFLPPEEWEFLPSGGSFMDPDSLGVSVTCPTLEIESRRFIFNMHVWNSPAPMGPRLVAVEADPGTGPMALPFESRDRGAVGVLYLVNWDVGALARRIADRGLTLRFRLEDPARTLELKLSPRRQVR